MSQERLWHGGLRLLRDLAIFAVIVVAIQMWQKREVVRGPALALAGPLAGGGSGSLEAARRAAPGRPLLLYFWAEWCPICKAVESSVTAVGHDVPLLTVAMQSGDAAAVAALLAARGLRWPALADADGRMAASYGLHGVPAFVIIDATGQVRFVELGYTSQAGIRLRLWWAEHFSS